MSQSRCPHLKTPHVSNHAQSPHRTGASLLTASVCLLLTACVSQPTSKPPVKVVTPQPSVQPPPKVIVVKPTATPKPMPPATVTPTPQPSYGFAGWKQDFSIKALAAGHNAYDVQRMLAATELNHRVISSDANQAEFVKMPWEYLDSAVSRARVNSGQSNLASQRTLLTSLEARYGVPAQIVTAIWGMESAYGQVTGNTHLPSALASLAYDGRRQAFAEEQLLALLTLLERGDVSWYPLTGSWAGGMGHTQFIPATWLAHGVDGDGDGRKNPWSTADALSSTANYLSNSGWVRGLSPYIEVSLPAGFDYRQVGSKQSLDAWRQLGMTSVGSTYLGGVTPAELWLPAGQAGPALLLTPNFDVIKVYNNSSNYALAISLLADAIVGQSGLQQSWPRYERPISSAQARNLQQNLTRAGYDTKGIDGVIGSNTRRAFARWQADHGQVADGFISQRSAGDMVW